MAGETYDTFLNLTPAQINPQPSYMPAAQPQYAAATPVVEPSAAASATAANPQGTGKFLGYDKNQWAAMLGQMANAIGGGKTMGARLGQIAAQLGTAQIQAAMAKNQQQSYSQFVSDILKSTPPNFLNRFNTLLGQMNTGAPTSDMNDWFNKMSGGTNTGDPSQAQQA